MTDTNDPRKVGQTITAKDFHIGDIVAMKGMTDPFNSTVVRNIRTEDRYDAKFIPRAYLSRPRVVLSDWITTAGVDVALATEEYTVALDASTEFVLLRKSEAERHERAMREEREKQDAEIKRLREHAERQHKEIAALVREAQTAADKSEELRRRLDDQSEANAVADGARKAAEQALANVKADLKTERTRAEGLRDTLAKALDAALTGEVAQ